MDDFASGSFGLIGVFMFLFVLFLGILWCVLPFAVFGTKPRLDELIREQKKTNKLLIEIAVTSLSEHNKQDS